MFGYSANFYRAEISRWVDGDTVYLRVDLGQNVLVQDKYRLARIDAPEVALYRGVSPEEKTAGLALKGELEVLYPQGTDVWVQTSKSGKYGRWLVEMWVPGEEDSWLHLNQALLDTGRAASYDS